jgi:alkanesulfonate monooxygenase SsuD/methylene tetrahydromethanopterin reductase-like flavin-dependent oxidoreductase (luciferase family)
MPTAEHETHAAMRLGLCLPQFGPHCHAARVSRFARTAEELGYGSLWVGDRVLAPIEPSNLYPVGGTPEQPYPPELTAALTHSSRSPAPQPRPTRSGSVRARSTRRGA